MTTGLVAGCAPDSAAPRENPAAQNATAQNTTAQNATALENTAVTATGRYQAGLTEPRTAQRNLLAVIADVTADVTDPADAGGLLAELGRTVLGLTAGTDARLCGLAPGDLTVTIGIGPRLVRRAGATLPGSTELPRFSHERIEARHRGGDVFLQICASDALLLPTAAAALLNATGGRLEERWRQSGRRGPAVPLGEGRTAPRNLLGFVDGIIGPHSTAEQRRDLWLAGPAPVAGGTIAVLRRMEVEVSRFAALSTSEQEAVFGRHRDSGAPLSGGPVSAGVDLGAKTPTGRYVVPADAHARRAHANVVGAGLMLRRSYSIDDPAPGLLFVSFQRALRTFTATLTHMQAADALLGFTSTTASASFLMLPGFGPDRPLGAALFPG